MNWLLLKNSLFVSGLATLLAITLGFAVALWLIGQTAHWRHGFIGLAVVTLALPPFLVCNAWLHYLGLTGVWRSWLPFEIYSLKGAVLILALMLWPITALLVSSAWQRLEASQVESDPALNGAALVRWLLWPTAKRALGLATVLTFVLALNNFAVPAILQVKVFPAEVWVRFNTNLDSVAALEVSWPLILAPLLLIVLFGRESVAWTSAGEYVLASAFRRQLGAGWFYFSGAMTVLTSLLSVGLPLTQLLATPTTWSQFYPAFKAGVSACAHSFAFAALTSTIILALGMSTTRWRAGAWLWIPFFVPGVLLGIGLIWALNRNPLVLLYHSLGVVIIAFTFRYLAIGWNAVAFAVRNVDADLTDAARLNGASSWQLWRHVRWPQLAPQLAAAWYVTYLLCLWDVESLVLIVPPGGETLALRIFNLLHYGHNTQVNALCLLLLLLAILPLLVWGCWRWLCDLLKTRASFRPRPSSSSSCSNQKQSLADEDEERGRGGYLSARDGIAFSLSPQRGEGQGEGCANSNDGIQQGISQRGPFVRFIFGLLGQATPHPQSLSPLRGEGRQARRRPAQARTQWVKLSFCCGVLLFSSCAEKSSTLAPIKSRLFTSVQVIGTRGAGLGEFNKPRSVAVDANDNFYVVDMTGRVQKFSPDGSFLLSWQMPQTDKGKPKGLCRDAAGNIVVVEPHYSRVNHFSPDGKLAEQWGEHGTNASQLAFPRAAAVNSRGEIFVSEYGLVERVQGFSSSGKKLQTSFGKAGNGPGEFNRAEGLGVDSADRIYVADSCNHRIQVFSPDGKWLRVYGKAGSGQGELSYPYDVRVDASGLQFVCEFGNSRIQIFDANDQPVEILGHAGGDPGQFSNPWSIALDSHGNLYVADSGNHRVQKFLRKTTVANTTARKLQQTKAVLLAAVSSPFTPALSPRKRENRFPVFGESGAPRWFERWTVRLPLPKGEGRGDGEEGAEDAANTTIYQRRIATAAFVHLDHSLGSGGRVP